MRALRGRHAPRGLLPVASALLLAWRGPSAEARLFADLRAEDLAPPPPGGRPEGAADERLSACLAELRRDCFAERAGGGGGGAPAAPLPHVRVLLLITSVWRNFGRRRLLRRALSACRSIASLQQRPHDTLIWRFLLGNSPAWLLKKAAAEVAANEDLMLVGGEDEMEYSHVGDAYLLSDTNPEIRKIVRALRAASRSLTFDFLTQVDDDSFVNLPNMFEILGYLPKERVYVGNMIDTVPQRGGLSKRVTPEYSVNIYLSAPSKVPVFAHGMGFIVSSDVALLMANMGLQLKSRANDDLLLGVWFRNVEHLYYLHYWIWMFDHEEFGGMFALPCDVTAIIVHRMNSERWRRFSPSECHVCGPAAPPMPDEADLSPRAAGSPGGAAGPEAPGSERPVCEWDPAARGRALLASVGAGGLRGGVCRGRCLAEASVNGTAGACPPPLCDAMCAASAGPAPERRAPPALAICIFGSAWRDSRRRLALRRALRDCSRGGLGTGGAAWVFMMGPLPPVGSPLARRRAAREALHSGDISIAHFGPTDAGGSGSTYAYADAWRVVEERFESPAFVLFLDHRSFVDVPFVVHSLLPRLPASKVYAGSFVEEASFLTCTGQGSSSCDFLRRQRAATFAHGMGFVVSSDVARFVSDAAASLRAGRGDVPADVAFGMWLRAIEGLRYEAFPEHFVLQRPAGVAGAAPAVAFPMAAGDWGRFQAATCSLAPAGPPAPPAAAPPRSGAEGAEALGRLLGFGRRELQLLLAGLSNVTRHLPAEAGRAGGAPCGTPRGCGEGALLCWYERLWEAGLLPLRHPWATDVQDELFGVGMKLRSENTGWSPRGHEHTFERVQLGRWLRRASERIRPEEVPGERRCLEWDSAQYSRHFFARHCSVMDVLNYNADFGVAAHVVPGSNGQRRYVVDIHDAEGTIPAGSVGIALCGQVFEHLRRPHVAIRQLFRAVAPGGYVVWSAPFFSELHGAPDDFFRYTPLGARSLAEGAGFEVVELYAPGGRPQLVGYLLGMTAPYWREEELLEETGPAWPLQVYMLLRKPPQTASPPPQG